MNPLPRPDRSRARSRRSCWRRRRSPRPSRSSRRPPPPKPPPPVRTKPKVQPKPAADAEADAHAVAGSRRAVADRRLAAPDPTPPAAGRRPLPPRRAGRAGDRPSDDGTHRAEERLASRVQHRQAGLSGAVEASRRNGHRDGEVRRRPDGQARKHRTEKEQRLRRVSTTPRSPPCARAPASPIWRTARRFAPRTTQPFVLQSERLMSRISKKQELQCKTTDWRTSGRKGIS